MIEIPGGEVVVGDEGKERTVHVDAFFIDEHEVTNAEYGEVVATHEYREGAAGHPVTHVTFHEAQAYCEKRKARLPTGDEWEKAARGTDGRLYPWGNTLARRKPHPFYSGVVKKTAGSNRKDVSPYGVRDMAGSVWEWTDAGDGDQRETRGGLWNLHLDFEYSKTLDRNRLPADSRFLFLGFRCARSAN
ncbi:putative Serine/threonine protein kinase [Nitrospina gracilis 3/211]|uniref:Putative Serine/threonine protein kinase n=1 Tax=Nitrospina gracilis (strain 3/211) TaxID=1266370 RepID=M1YXG3_NITG3|nr:MULTISPECIES: SUMF1/EgtB/PvdO family nonheme iron enzyme [Nitrospina]MCF8722374.1 formylglycine-generating enzyme required for sulfatase activity [Nitrospina sp. Nb-3]CCQ89988.1 putative Serine/threonine protein kinase [Nitrospina gracilis 3/211]